MDITQINNWIDERIAESEGYLEENGTTYEAVLEHEDTTGYGEDGENNNFEAGVISGLKQLKQELLK